MWSSPTNKHAIVEEGNLLGPPALAKKLWTTKEVERGGISCSQGSVP